MEKVGEFREEGLVGETTRVRGKKSRDGLFCED